MMSLSRMRLLSHVSPTRLSKAVNSSTEHHISSALRQSIYTTPLPPLLFSAVFESALSSSSSKKGISLASPSNLKSQPQNRSLTHHPRNAASPVSNSRSHNRAYSNKDVSPPHSAPSPPLASPWHAPAIPLSRPITILGSGVLGRRLAVIWASTGQPVTLYDTSPSALISSQSFVADALSSYCADQGTLPGKVHFTKSFHDACSSTLAHQSPWMVIDCLPENLELKTSILGRVDRTVSRDCIIATNSASFRSRDLVVEVQHRERVLNTLYYVPPANRCVELMSCGSTAPNLIPFLKARMQEVGLTPLHVRNESMGMIFPRLFGAMKRETLKILQEGVAVPEEVDELFKDFFGSKRGVCAMMDRVGLDTVASTERRWLDSRPERERGGNEDYLEWLEGKYVEKGKLGEKSGSGLIAGSKQGLEMDGIVKGNKNGEVWNGHAGDLSGV